MKSFRVFIVFTILSFVVLSCSSPKKIIERETSFDEILKSMRINSERINSYSANGNLDLNLKEIKATIQIYMQVLRPHYVIIDLFGPFGFDVASFYLNNDSIIIYNAVNNEVIKTSLSSERIKEDHFLATAFKIIYPAFFGFLEIEAIDDDSSLVLSTKNKICLIKYLEKNRLDLCYDKLNLFLSEIFYQPNSSNEKFELYFRDLKNFDSIKFPTTIIFNRPNSQESISISIKKIEFNKIEGNLEFSIPDNAEVKVW